MRVILDHVEVTRQGRREAPPGAELAAYGAPGGIETMNIVGAKFIVHSSCLASKEEW